VPETKQLFELAVVIAREGQRSVSTAVIHFRLEFIAGGRIAGVADALFGVAEVFLFLQVGESLADGLARTGARSHELGAIGTVERGEVINPSVPALTGVAEITHNGNVSYGRDYARNIINHRYLTNLTDTIWVAVPWGKPTITRYASAPSTTTWNSPCTKIGQTFASCCNRVGVIPTIYDDILMPAITERTVCCR